MFTLNTDQSQKLKNNDNKRNYNIYYTFYIFLLQYLHHNSFWQYIKSICKRKKSSESKNKIFISFYIITSILSLFLLKFCTFTDTNFDLFIFKKNLRKNSKAVLEVKEVTSGSLT